MLSVLANAAAFAAAPAPFTESDFRASLGVAAPVQLSYRGLDCNPLSFDDFAQAMAQSGVRSDVERAVDGTAVTVTVRRKGGGECSSPYPPVAELPPFQLRDLAGKRGERREPQGQTHAHQFLFCRVRAMHS